MEFVTNFNKEDYKDLLESGYTSDNQEKLEKLRLMLPLRTPKKKVINLQYKDKTYNGLISVGKVVHDVCVEGKCDYRLKVSNVLIIKVVLDLYIIEELSNNNNNIIIDDKRYYLGEMQEDLANNKIICEFVSYEAIEGEYDEI